MPEWKVPGYTEVRALGSGGFGEVVLARQDASGALVAIKYLRRELLADAESAELFRAEAAVLASLDDPNVVRLYEYVEGPAGAAIVMELIDGVSLREILARQGATSAQAALVVLQGSLLGLAAAHQRGVVHRDYKPENVLVDGQGVSKLTDFGIAARAGDRAIAAGTLAYAPPEQFAGAPASPAGDVYAATATFYECLTGRPPFTGGTAEALLAQHRSDPVPLEPVPEPLRPLVTAGMAKDPAARPVDAAVFVAELRKTASWTYGQDWEERGRSHLGEAALLLAALWPSGAAPAAQGHAVQQVHLSRGAHQPQAPQHPGNLDHLRHAEHAEHAEHAQHVEHAEHLEHLQHVEHAEHLEHVEHAGHLGQSPPGHPAPGNPAAADVAKPAGPGSGAPPTVVAPAATPAAAGATPPVPNQWAAQPHVAGRAGPRLRRALRRRPAVTAGLVVVALAVAGTAIAVTAGGSGGPPTSVSIAINSARPPDTGDVYVVYDDGNDSNAQISGQVPDAASGQVARLYAQPFPFTAAPAPVASLALQPTGDSARYAFTVTPSVATRYDVEVFSSGTATTPTDRSPVSTVYVTTGASSSYSQNCTSGTCVITMTFTVTVPAAEMRTEIAKPLYLYFGDTLASSGSTAPTPTSVQLGGGDAKASPNQQVSATQFRFTATFTYQVGSGDSHWAQDLCAKDSVAQDGIGLPGSHNCGDSSLHFPPGYLG